MRISRRRFGALTASALAGPLALHGRGAAAVAAADIIDRIKKDIGLDWSSETVDGLKAGDPATPITGIVTTALASLAVLRQAVDAKANMVITSEPTFYSRSDAQKPPAGRGGRGAPAAPPPAAIDDPVFAAKRALIERHGLVVFRLSDHWRRRRPDPFAEGLASALGFKREGEGSHYTVSPVALRSLASDIRKKLRSRGGIRVVGDPQLRVRTIALLPGSTPIGAALAALPQVDVIVAGEVREWESVEYARDAAFAGGRKALVTIGRIVSEESGMSACAQWLGKLVPEVRVRHVAAGDPYWRPE
jgi:putative NIF3 family GTP cyclohydrolase 1 type 2